MSRIWTVKEGIMAAKYKEIKNGNGTNLTISEGRYITIGKDGKDVTIRGNDKVIYFTTWDDLVNAIDVSKAIYANDDKTGPLK